MGLGTAVADLVLQWAAKRSTMDKLGPRLGNPWMAGQTVYPEWSTERAVKEGYKASYIYYTVASDLAGCIRSVPWVLKRKTKDGAELVDIHPLMEMLRSPNSQMSWGALTEVWDIFKSLDGNAYGHFTQILDEMKMWLLRNDRVNIKLDKRGHIGSYKYTIGGEDDFYPPEEIVHMKFFDPGNDHYGLAPLQAGAPIIDTLNSSIDWNKYSMGNRAIFDMIVAPDKGVKLSPTQYADWLKMIDKQIHGPKNQHKFFINSFGVQIAEMSRSPVEMDFIKSTAFYEAAACKILHVHPEAIGALGATFENKEWAITDKWQGAIESRLSEMRSALNHRFRVLFGTSDPKLAAPGELFLDYDLSDTPGASAAQEKALDRAVKAWNLGVPWNVVDEKFGVGIGSIPGGDVGYLPVNLLPVGTPLPEGRSSRSFNLQTDEQFVAHWRGTARRKQGWERGVAVKVAEEFAQEREAVVKAIKAGHVDIDYVVNAQRPSWEKLLTTVMRDVIKDFGGQVADDLNEGVSEVGPTPQKATAAFSDDLGVRQGYEFDPWTKAIQKWVTSRTAKDVKAIAETTKKALRKTILAGLKDGKSMIKIAKEVEAVYRHWEKVVGLVDPTTGRPVMARAVLIATNEIHGAAGYGMNESAKQSGVVKKKHWLDAGDEKVRPAHLDNTAEGWIAFDDAYSNGAAFPGDGTDDIGCRCVQMFRSR